MIITSDVNGVQWRSHFVQITYIRCDFNHASITTLISHFSMRQITLNDVIYNFFKYNINKSVNDEFVKRLLTFSLLASILRNLLDDFEDEVWELIN